MPEFMETTVDKFTFKVAADRAYTADGLWATAAGNMVRVGLSDYLQQRSGDVAFVDIKPAGTLVGSADELATLETIKVNTSLSSPVSGKVVQVNPALDSSPELINSDPYGTGWLAVIEALDWATEQTRLLTAQQYFEQMKQQAEQEAKKS
ncbi:MAG TPA: glycine cleavage system protein H [Anaerolineae bacterium]